MKKAYSLVVLFFGLNQVASAQKPSEIADAAEMYHYLESPLWKKLPDLTTATLLKAGLFANLSPEKFVRNSRMNEFNVRQRRVDFSIAISTLAYNTYDRVKAREDAVTRDSILKNFKRDDLIKVAEYFSDLSEYLIEKEDELATTEPVLREFGPDGKPARSDKEVYKTEYKNIALWKERLADWRRVLLDELVKQEEDRLKKVEPNSPVRMRFPADAPVPKTTVSPVGQGR